MCFLFIKLRKEQQQSEMKPKKTLDKKKKKITKNKIQKNIFFREIFGFLFSNCQTRAQTMHNYQIPLHTYTRTIDIQRVRQVIFIFNIFLRILYIYS